MSKIDLKALERNQILANLKEQSYDLLIIGGGATGTGAALDGARRGLKTALIERKDFASGTSSRSTKLVHGGVRYLEKAILGFDRGEFSLVMSALNEREHLVYSAPHLAQKLKLITPCYSYFKIPYLYTGLALYDFISGKASFGRSQLLSSKKVLEMVPHLNPKGLKGGVLYWDGQFDDARFNVELALTASDQGADVLNYCEVTEFIKSRGCIVGVKAKDLTSDQIFTISAKVVVNATGPYVDNLRKLDDQDSSPILRVSSGSHIVVSLKQPIDTAILIPQTSDGRVVFIIPWKGDLMIGTTDVACSKTDAPKPTDEEVEYLIENANNYLSSPISRSDVKSAWSGLRPLVQREAETDSTASLSRDHYIITSPSGLVTITGGKWTTYRLMAMEVINRVTEMGRFKGLKACSTKGFELRGAQGILREFSMDLELQRLQVSGGQIDADIIEHLRSTYGVKSVEILKIFKSIPEMLERIIPEAPFTKGELFYCWQTELIVIPEDYLYRRVRVGFLNDKLTKMLEPKVATLFAEFSSYS